MKHSDVLCRKNMDQASTVHMPNLYEAWLEREDIRVEHRKGLWIAFPCDLPIRPCTPTIPIDKEAVISVAEKEFACHTLDMNRLDVFFSCHEIERGVGLIEQRLRLESFETDNFEAACASDAKFRS